jgi:site-specific recombinase XerD
MIPSGKEAQSMLEKIFEVPFFLRRHEDVPLLKERAQFLVHQLDLGTDRLSVRALSAELLIVVKTLKLTALRDVTMSEIDRAAERWAKLRRTHPEGAGGPSVAPFFKYAAKKWLAFHGRLKLPVCAPVPFANLLEDFAVHMLHEQGFSEHSVASHRWKTLQFLRWFAEHKRPIASVTLDDVDEFLAFQGRNGWSRKSVSVGAQALRAFFRHAERRGWCSTGIAGNIQGPKIYSQEGLPEGPTWTEVQGLMRADGVNRAAAIRARAILLLFAVYGLRSGEVARLLLSDIDWRAETLVVNHSKRHGQQRYPLDRTVGDAILEYLTTTRPQCACRHLFVTLKPPFRPVATSSLWQMTRSRYQRTGIQCRRRGPHTLRHACATHLLQQGASFKEIGDFLGHRSAESAGIYAKVDLTTLRQVADFSLGGLL